MTEHELILAPLLTDPSKIDREAVKRRNRFEQITVSKADVENYISIGWELDRELKRLTRLKRPLAIDAQLENRVWMLFYLMGYHELNSGRNFTIQIERKGADPTRKQIDVFARDEETVIVAECKASERIRRRNLQKDVEEFANLKGYMASAIKKHYGYDFKPKIIWLFITQNVIWSKPDQDRAASENIRIITERELRYFAQIADHLRKASRFQFLAEFLKDQKIPELQDKKVPAIRGKLGGQRFYSFVTTPKQLLKTAFVNHRSLNDPDGAPTYQRLVSRSRLHQIGNFILGGGFFPTNILVNFTRKVRFELVTKDELADVQFGYLYMPDRYRSVWIIDGQHRLYGYAPLEEKYLNENIVVIAFDGLSKTQEANLFITINHEQQRVPKTLLDDLEGELKWGSEIPSERIGAISAKLISILNMDLGEPLYGRVTQQGITATEKTCLTVPALKDGLRRSGLLGRAILKRQEYEPGPLSGISDSETLDRARSTINQYLGLIRASNEIQWENGRQGFLCTNVGIQAQLLLLAALISYMEPNKGLIARELSPENLITEIEEYMDPLLRWFHEASPAMIEHEFKVQFGSGGPPEYYFRLCRIIKEQYSDFVPEGMEEWQQEQSTERISAADRKLKELNILVQKHIFDTFKAQYGAEREAYWHKGVLDKNIKSRAYEKSLDDDDEDRLPLENYLDFIEYKKIVENKTHWALFKSVFDIPDPGEKGYSKNVRWMERVNELRRIPAHATESRYYKLQDFEYIDYIHEEFTKRVNGKESLYNG